MSFSDSFLAETGLWIVNKRCGQFYVLLDMTHDLRLQLIDIVETVYRGASKGRGLVVSPKGRLDVTFNSTYRNSSFCQIIQHDTDIKR